ncbi:MAG TPA: SDR family NAD(P)-dependent oxidoreductase, partial [Spirochaetia bacterium]
MSLASMLSLEGRVALVTGASRGLGRAFAAALAEAGADVAVSCRHAAGLSDTVAAITACGRRAVPIEADVTDEKQVRAMVERVTSGLGRLDILVNNAGAERINVPPEEQSLESWKAVLDTNVNGAFLCAREAGRAMIPRGK